MSEHHNLYQRAVYYDIVFGRPVDHEVQFFVDAYRHYTGRALQSTLEIGCGPAYHTRRLAQRGLTTVGLDLWPEMIELAQEKANADGVTPHWLIADMRDFALSAPVDFAFCVFDGIDALLKNEEYVQHFQAIARNLTPGGLYLIDVTHPREVDFHQYPLFCYQAEQDGIAVEVRWGTNRPYYDLTTGIYHVALEIDVDDHGKRSTIYDCSDERHLLPQELTLLAELSGTMRLVSWFGDFVLQQPLDHTPASKRMIGLFQKVGD